MKPSHADSLRDLQWDLVEWLPLKLVPARRRIGHAAALRQFARDHPHSRVTSVRTCAAEDDRVVVLVYHAPVDATVSPSDVACYVIPTDVAHEIPYDRDNPYYIISPR